MSKSGIPIATSFRVSQSRPSIGGSQVCLIVQAHPRSPFWVSQWLTDSAVISFSPWKHKGWCWSQLSMVPSGNLLHSYGKIHHFSGKLTMSIAIFNSYVDITRLGKFGWNFWMKTGTMVSLGFWVAQGSHQMTRPFSTPPSQCWERHGWHGLQVIWRMIHHGWKWLKHVELTEIGSQDRIQWLEGSVADEIPPGEIRGVAVRLWHGGDAWHGHLQIMVTHGRVIWGQHGRQSIHLFGYELGWNALSVWDLSGRFEGR